MNIANFLRWLSYVAILSTISLFLCGIPICISLVKRKFTGDISPFPLLMGVLSAGFWLRYGFLKSDSTMIIVNIVGILLFSIYCTVYWIYEDNKNCFAVKVGVIFLLIGSMLIWVEHAKNLDILGMLCMTLNIVNFGAPLAGLRVVIQKRSSESLPLPMCLFNLLVSSEWFFYGNLVQDLYLMIPNGIGMCLAISQLSLFIIFPRNKQKKYALCCNMCSSKKQEKEGESSKEPNISSVGNIKNIPDKNDGPQLNHFTQNDSTE